VNIQPAVFLTMGKFAKPDNFGWLTAKCAEMFTAANEVKRKDFKAPPNHIQTVIDGINMFSYPFFQPGDELRDYMKDTFEQISFYGNKVLNL
jgi:hypothetical protein